MATCCWLNSTSIGAARCFPAGGSPRWGKFSDPPLEATGRAPSRCHLTFKPRPSRGFSLAGAQSMNRAQEQKHLAQADRHIAEVKAHIARQRVRNFAALAAQACKVRVSQRG
jgi:hypothetical protein